MVDADREELEFLADLLEKHPTDSLRKISEEEGVDYYRLKRLYDKYYGKYFYVNTVFNIDVIGLKSFVAFLSVPRDEIRSVAEKMLRNPFVAYLNPVFGFKNGLSGILYVPKDQVNLIGEYLGRYSDDYEYYEARSYPLTEGITYGDWNLSYDYAVLMDILRVDARTPISKISQRLGKSRTTVKYMISRLKNLDLIRTYIVSYDVPGYDRGILGLTKDLKEEIFNVFKERELLIGVLVGYGYSVECFFSSTEDLADKILEFSKYVDKFVVEYFDVIDDLVDKYTKTIYSRMVKKDGSGYHSILDF
ncbi:winged helix-turn-helix transcriptional regulator [Thermococcus sp.]